MVPMLTTAEAASPEASREMARRFQADLLPLQAGITSSMSVSTTPPRALPWSVLPLNQFVRLTAKLTFDTHLLDQAMAQLLNRQSKAIGLREMELSAFDVAELRRHIERPSALPKIPLRRVPEEDVDDFE